MQRPLTDWRSDGLLLLILVLAALSYFWIARVPGAPWFNEVANDHYTLQAEGFRQGHLHAAVEPRPELLALPDPYDPVANAPYRIHDMSLWNGKYYLYFGPAPIVLFILPFRWITGWYPADFVVVPTFCTVGLIFAAAALRSAQRRYFPDASTWVLLLLVAALSWGNPALHLNHPVQFYQIAISCAYALGMMAIWAYERAFASETRRLRWFVIGSLGLGLTLAARPNYLFGVGGALLVAGLALYRPANQPLAVWLRAQSRLVLSILGPVALVGVGLLAYNHLRFGDLLEFGTRYQLAGSNQLHLAALHPRHIPPHGAEYLFQSVVWQPYFPFLDVAPGEPVGVFRYLPLAVVSLWLLVVVGKTWRQERTLEPPLVWSGMALGMGTGNALAVSAVAFPPLLRYAPDFAPYFLLAGAVVLLRWLHRSRNRRWAVMASAGISLWCVAVVVAVQVANTPAASRSVEWSRRLNLPTAWWQQLMGHQHGPLQLRLQLPPAEAGQVEPLLQSGFTPDRRNWVALRFLSHDRAVVVYFHAGLGELVSEPFDVPPDREVTVEIRSGMLLPPVTHPIYRDWDATAVREARGEVAILVEDQEVLRTFVEAYPTRPTDLEVGVMGLAAAGETRRRFSGDLLKVERLPLQASSAVPRERPLPRNALQVELLLPAIPHGYDPLLATDTGNQSDLIYAVYTSGPNGPQVQFGFDHYGVGGTLTPPVPYDPRTTHRLTVWMGSWAATSSTTPDDSWGQRLVLVFDGQVLIDDRLEFYPANDHPLIIGENRHGAGSAGMAFSGRITSLKDVPLFELPVASGPAPVQAR